MNMATTTFFKINFCLSLLNTLIFFTYFMKLYLKEIVKSKKVKNV
jgi:hypothetical protein